MHGFLSAATDDDEPLAGAQLRELRILAGCSQPALERCSGLSAGRVANVENGRARFRPQEWIKVKALLYEALVDRAREIAKYIPRDEKREAAAETSPP